MVGCDLSDFVDDVVISEVVGLSKLDLCIYYFVLKRLGVMMVYSWFVGDLLCNDVWGL